MNITYEYGKLFLLSIALSSCFITFFTSKSFSTGDNGIKTISRINMSQYCKVPAQQYHAANCKPLDPNPKNPTNPQRKSEKDEESNCHELHQKVIKCQTTVTKAYRDINLKTCVKELQAVSICEQNMETCIAQGLLLNGAATTKEIKKTCREICQPIQQHLETCISDHVSNSFQNSGLNRNGTVMSFKLDTNALESSTVSR